MPAPFACLLALAFLVGFIAGWLIGGPRVLLRLLNKPQRTPPPILIPPGPAPRLVPGDSPRATRAQAMPAPGPRQIPIGPRRSGPIDYIAVFTGSPNGRNSARLDYLLESGDDDDGPPPTKPEKAR